MGAHHVGCALPDQEPDLAGTTILIEQLGEPANVGHRTQKGEEAGRVHEK